MNVQVRYQVVLCSVPDPWRLRIRIRGSVSLGYGSGSRSFSVFSWLLRYQKSIFSQFCLLITNLTVGVFTTVFENNQLLKRHKTVEIKVFLNFSLVNGRIRIRTNNFDPNLGIWRILRLALDPDNSFNFTFVAHFVFLRCLDTQRASMESRRATNLATHLPT